MTALFAFAPDIDVGPPVWSEDGKAWMLTRHADVQALLRTQATQNIEFQSQIQAIALRTGRNYDCLVRLLSGVLFFRNPPWQKRARTALHKAMTAVGARMSDAELAPVVGDAVASASRTDASFVDVVPPLANRIPVLVIAHLLGLSEATVDTLNRQGKGVVNAWRRAMPLRAYAALEEQAIQIDGALRSEMDRARRDGGPLLAFLNELDGFDDGEIVGLIFGLVMAGIETTSGLLGSVLYAMAAEPRHLAAGEDPAVPDKSFVDEVLRMAPPLRRPSARRLGEDLQMGGVTLASGSLVSVDIMTAQRDPAVYDDPHTFAPRRGGGALLAFGSGAHTCLGIQLAMLEARLTLRAAQEFDLAFPHPHAAEWDPDPTFCRLQRLDLRLTPAKKGLPPDAERPAAEPFRRAGVDHHLHRVGDRS